MNTIRPELPDVTWRVSPYSLTRRAFLLMLLAGLLVMPVVVMPVPTLNPAVHSKELTCRFLVAILAVLFVGTWRRLKVPPLDPPQIGFLAVILTNIVSTLTSGRIGFCFFSSWHLWGLVLLAWAIYAYVPAPRHYGKFVIVVIVAGVAVALYGIGAYFGIDPLKRIYHFSFAKDEARNYIHSFLGNPEYFGGYMAPLAVLCVSRIFRASSTTERRVAWAVMTLFFLFSLLLSGARGGLLGFGIGAILIVGWELPRMARENRRHIRQLIGAAIAVVGIGVLILSFPNPLNYRDVRLLGRFRDALNLSSASIRERILFYSISEQMIAQHPAVGIGPGAFRLEFYPAVDSLERADPRNGVMMMIGDLQNRIAEHAHNDYLEIWAETGTLGIAAFLLLLSTLLVRFWRTPTAIRRGAVISARVESLALYRLGFFAGGACIFLNAVSSFPLHLPVRASLAWVFVGLFLTSDRALRQFE